MYWATVNELNTTKKESVAIVVLLDFKKIQRCIDVTLSTSNMEGFAKLVNS